MISTCKCYLTLHSSIILPDWIMILIKTWPPFSTKPSALRACLVVENSCSKPSGFVNFQLAINLFPIMPLQSKPSYCCIIPFLIILPPVLTTKSIKEIKSRIINGRFDFPQLQIQSIKQIQSPIINGRIDLLQLQIQWSTMVAVLLGME